MLKFFYINIRGEKFRHPLPVKWEFPSPCWVKINTDDLARGSLGLATCGGIFHGSIGEFIGGFASFIDIKIALVIEFYGVIHAIKEAKTIGFTCLWLECDSALVCVAFTARTNVPWILHNRWNNCLNYCEKTRSCA